MLAQAPDLSAMLSMSGARKIEACDNLDNMQLKLGPAEVMQLMECGGKYPAAFKRVKAFCATGDISQVAPGAHSVHSCSKHMCDIAKAQSPFVCIHI